MLDFRCAPTARRAFQVVDDAARAVVDLVAGLAQAQAQVHVLVAVAVSRVEAAHRLEGSAANQHTRRRDNLKSSRLEDGGVVARKAKIEMPRVAVLADDHPRVLDRAVGVEQPTPHHRCGRVRLDILDQGIQPAWCWDSIVVEEYEIVPRRCPRPIVTTGSEASILGVSDNANPLVIARQQGRSRITRGVVHDNHLPVARCRRVRHESVEALTGQRGVVIDRDDDGTAWHIAYVLSLPGLSSRLTR